jgi:hypothetical protein
MDLKLIRQLLRSGSPVVLLEDGHMPLTVQELRSTGAPSPAQEADEPPQEVQISSRWPKGRSPFDRERQDQVLERLNKEILALREQIAQEEGAPGPVRSE